MHPQYCKAQHCGPLPLAWIPCYSNATCVLQAKNKKKTTGAKKRIMRRLTCVPSIHVINFPAIVVLIVYLDWLGQPINF